MAKKRIYVESSVISWLTANPPRDIFKLAKQRYTQLWWERRHKWDLFISPVVIAEIERGDPAASRKRVAIIFDVPRLPESDASRRLTDRFIAAGVFPKKAREDATHMAIAAVQGMDYLVTWNQKHLVNPEILVGLHLETRDAGYTPPVIAHPVHFLEEEDGA